VAAHHGSIQRKSSPSWLRSLQHKCYLLRSVSFSARQQKCRNIRHKWQLIMVASSASLHPRGYEVCSTSVSSSEVSSFSARQQKCRPHSTTVISSAPPPASVSSSASKCRLLSTSVGSSMKCAAHVPPSQWDVQHNRHLRSAHPAPGASLIIKCSSQMPPLSLLSSFLIAVASWAGNHSCRLAGATNMQPATSWQVGGVHYCLTAAQTVEYQSPIDRPAQSCLITSSPWADCPTISILPRLLTSALLC